MTETYFVVADHPSGLSQSDPIEDRDEALIEFGMMAEHYKGTGYEIFLETYHDDGTGIADDIIVTRSHERIV